MLGKLVGSELQIAKATLALEIVKTVLIAAGLIFAYSELTNTDKQMALTKERLTSEMIRSFGNEDVVLGATTLLQYEEYLGSSDSYLEFLVKLTPYKQQLVSWAACVESNSCSQKRSVELLCRYLTTYELTMSHVLPKFGQIYQRERREQNYFGRLGKCETEFPDMTTELKKSIANRFAL